MTIKVRRVDFHADEWIAGTVSLSLAERGLYITACALIYSHGGPIEIDHLCGACREHGNTFNAILNRLIKLGKLIRKGSLLCNKRAAKEVQNAVKRVSKARQNGAKGGRNKGLAKPGGFQPRTKNHQKILPLQGENLLLMGGSNEPTTASSPPMGEAVELKERGARLIGNSPIVQQQIVAVGEEKVTRALDALERTKPDRPIAYFLACCRGPAAAVIKEQPMSREEIERHAAERREAARLEYRREAGLCADD